MTMGHVYEFTTHQDGDCAKCGNRFHRGERVLLTAEGVIHPDCIHDPIAEMERAGRQIHMMRTAYSRVFGG
jgi:hypothetical protein